MDTTLKQCTPTELEDRAMSGQADAAIELALRYRTGTGGVAQDAGEAERWLDRALQMDPEAAEAPAAADDGPNLPEDTLAEDREPGEEADFARWHTAYVQGAYDHAESWPLQTEAQNGNPYAAFVLAERYRNSRTLDDHSEIRPLLENARAVLERRVATARDEDACALLVKVLTNLGHLYADQACREEDLQKAWTCFSNALELDQNTVEDLLWFCNGPAVRMERFVQDPESLQQLRFRLMAQQAENHGIRQRLDYALQLCRIRQLDKAADWLQKALDAADAAEQPDLCILARYHQRRVRGEHPDLGELKQIAPHNAEVCLLLADLAQNDEERLIWYAAGAEAGSDSYADVCRNKQNILLKKMEEQERNARRSAAESAARKAAIAREKAARRAAEEKERQDRDALHAQWRAQAQTGVYRNTLHNDLLQLARNGNPYAAFTLAERLLQSPTGNGRPGALPLLEQCRDLLDTAVTAQGDAYDRKLLAQTLAMLGSLYADQVSLASLLKAHDDLQRAAALDSSLRKDLLLFYERHGKSLPEYRNDPAGLDKRCLTLAREIAGKGGIAEQMYFVRFCLDHKNEEEVQEGLRLALQAPDAAVHPDLCAIARYYQAVVNGQTPDVEALRRMAPHNSWACLILGDIAQDAREKSAYYYGGARLAPALTANPNMADRCARKFGLPAEPITPKNSKGADPAVALRNSRIEEARFTWMALTWPVEDHSGATDEELRREWQAGNPFAAGLLGLRALGDHSAQKRAEGVQILTDACQIAQDALRNTQRAEFGSLLVQLLPPLGRSLAAEGRSQAELKQAMDCLSRAYRMDPSTGASLLWFYQGPAQKLPVFVQDPERLRILTLNLQMELAPGKGIKACVALAEDCLRRGDDQNACICLERGLKTADAAEYPHLCAAAHFFVQSRSRFDTSTADVEKAAAAGCSLACLLLGDRSHDRKEKLRYYQQGARIDPETEKGYSCAKDCARKLQALRHASASGPIFGWKKFL